jgi:hypothetical protein
LLNGYSTATLQNILPIILRSADWHISSIKPKREFPGQRGLRKLRNDKTTIRQDCKTTSTTRTTVLQNYVDYENCGTTRLWMQRGQLNHRHYEDYELYEISRTTRLPRLQYYYEELQWRLHTIPMFLKVLKTFPINSSSYCLNAILTSLNSVFNLQLFPPQKYFIINFKPSPIRGGENEKWFRLIFFQCFRVALIPTGVFIGHVACDVPLRPTLTLCASDKITIFMIVPRWYRTLKQWNQMSSDCIKQRAIIYRQTMAN